MAPAPVVQQPEHGKARRMAEVGGADWVLPATAAPSSIQGEGRANKVFPLHAGPPHPRGRIVDPVAPRGRRERTTREGASQRRRGFAKRVSATVSFACRGGRFIPHNYLKRGVAPYLKMFPRSVCI
jgi:hypothetical protein